MRLKGKVAIVTGAARGIGQATAVMMAKEGASVVIADIEDEGAKKAAADIVKSGGQALGIKTDVAIEKEVKQMAEAAVSKFGRVDILVNNAALPGSAQTYKSFGDTEPAEWAREIDVCLMGTLLCTRAVIQGMIKQGSGRIISVSSDAGKFGVALMPIYSTVKAAIAGFTRALALDVATKGITVNCVSPGPIKTAAMAEALKTYKAGEEEWVSMVPMRRMGKPEDIAAMIVFLASEDANYITGQNYSVDGGNRM